MEQCVECRPWMRSKNGFAEYHHRPTMTHAIRNLSYSGSLPRGDHLRTRDAVTRFLRQGQEQTRGIWGTA